MHSIRPTININGDNRDSLVDAYRDAINKLDEAAEALRQLTPNGRNYFGNTEQYRLDRDEHGRRLTEISNIRYAYLGEAMRILFDA